MSWGDGEYGESPWGGLLAAGEDPLMPSSIECVYALGPHVIRVKLITAAQNLSVLHPGDANNPRTWGVGSAVDGDMHVIAVRRIDDATWDLYILTPMKPYGNQYIVASSTLRNTAGGLISDVLEVVQGCEAPNESLEAVPQPYDFANDPQDGRLRIDSSGDIAKHSGTALLRKLIQRRLVTMPGGFTYLPGYGLGIRAKEPLVSTDLVKLQAEIERQLLREPEIDAAKARLRLDSKGILYISVAAHLRSGDLVPVTIPVKVSLAL